MTRAVLDTNVLISGLLWPGGPPGRILDLWRAGRFVLCMTEDLEVELLGGLRRDEFRRLTAMSHEGAEALAAGVLDRAEFVVPSPLDRSVVVEDPDDDMLIAAARGAGATHLVSGDQHLLRLGGTESFAILAPREYLDLLTSTS